MGVRACAWLAATCVWVAPAWAQDEARGDVQNFEPAVGPGAIFSVEGADTLGSMKFLAGLGFNYASAPLVSVSASGDETRIVDQQLALNLMGGFGVADLVQVDVLMPLYPVNNVTIQGDDRSGFAVGDLQVRAKGALLSSADGPVGLGLQLGVGAPTGNSEAFVGAGGFAVTPELIADTRVGPVLLALNLGARFKPTIELSNQEQGSELRYGAGAQWGLMDGLLDVGAELFGRTPFAQAFSPDSTPLEGLVGVTLNTPVGLSVSTGAGGGLVAGYGSPEFRAFVNLTYDNEPREPLEPEIDPTQDTDEDGIPDVTDKCVDEPEDVDTFEDEDGCPDPDNDNDRVLDVDDTCPLELGDPANEGCPIVDQDGDGVLDAEDKCPTDPEDPDGFEDADGCPDKDNDDDGILDAEDACPLEKEDPDGWKDEDGCPEPDNDDDGIPDAEDKCPTEPETYNGNDDEDGCPDGKQTVVITKTSVQVTEKIFFATGKDTILKKSFGVLDVIATVLRRNPKVTKLSIQGHTDDVGDTVKNQRLSEARAAAVKVYLEGKGIDPSRLASVGYGESRPVCEDMAALSRTKRLARKNRKKIKECREAARRVEFKIIEIDGKAIEGASSVETTTEEVVEEPAPE
jgi:outer membrane protein OmpA-like peptidoglycan-associated protein